jgi:hypothetical protein
MGYDGGMVGSPEPRRSPGLPSPSRGWIPVARRSLFWGSGIGLTLSLVAPVEAAIGLTLLSYPALATAIFLGWFPQVSAGRQDLFVRILVGLAIAVVSGIGAALLVFATCMASFSLR